MTLMFGILYLIANRNIILHKVLLKYKYTTDKLAKVMTDQFLNANK